MMTFIRIDEEIVSKSKRIPEEMGPRRLEAVMHILSVHAHTSVRPRT